MTVSWLKEWRLILFIIMCSKVVGATAADDAYRFKAGDHLRITVWGESELDRDISVLPDGSISFPLVGRVVVSEATIDEVEALLTPALAEYMPAPEVSVVVLEASGSRFYVLGKVREPGVKVLDAPLTVVQALAIAGGLETFADENGIVMIRSNLGGEQITLKVDYSEIAKGDLDTNYRLLPGDVILVP